MLVLFAVLCIAAFAPFASTYAAARYNGIDFEAFYCGGRVLASGANPYLHEPLHACEARVHWIADRNDLLVPVPLLPVVIAAYVPLSLLPYAAAHAMWTLGLCIALVACAFVLARLADIPAAALAAPLAISGVLSITLGQVIPFVLLGALLCAFGLRAARIVPFACGLPLLAAQPAIFAPVAIACALFAPVRFRVTTLAVTSVLGIACIALAGVRENLVYLSTILPLQAYAELPNDTQLSLAGLLAQHGIAPHAALVAGGVSYVGAALAGIVAAVLAMRRWSDPAMLAIVPPAFAVFLGTYVHLQLYALAVPLAVVLAVRTQWRIAAVALLALCVPWHWASMTLYLIPALSIATIAFARTWITPSFSLAAGTGIVTAAAMFALALWYIHDAPPHLPAFTYHADPHALAEYTWIEVERTYGSIGESLAVDILRLISIASLGCVLVLAALALRTVKAREA